MRLPLDGLLDMSSPSRYPAKPPLFRKSFAPYSSAVSSGPGVRVSLGVCKEVILSDPGRRALLLDYTLPTCLYISPH